MKRFLAGASVTLAAAILACCSSSPSPRTANGQDSLNDETQAALNQFRQADPSMQSFLNNSYSYVVFPNVKEGAVGVGGAYGKGQVFQGNRMIGYADLSQANIGVQLGGQSFAEIVAFQNAGAFDQFRNGQLSFDARASAVAAAAGAASAADYQKGVAVFTTAQSGLMVQAAIGGQKFRYENTNGMANER